MGWNGGLQNPCPHPKPQDSECDLIWRIFADGHEAFRIDCSGLSEWALNQWQRVLIKDAKRRDTQGEGKVIFHWGLFRPRILFRKSNGAACQASTLFVLDSFLAIVCFCWPWWFGSAGWILCRISPNSPGCLLLFRIRLDFRVLWTSTMKV